MNLILTDIGAELASEGFISGVFPKVSKLRLGDGGGVAVEHDHTTTSLVNVVFETDSVAGLRRENNVTIVAVVPVQVGGFTVRELGLYTADDELIAVSRVANWIKPSMGDDPTEVMIEMKITFSSTQAIDVLFSYDSIYAAQSALAETNENVQILWDELQKKKNLGLSSSTVMLDGTASVLGVEKKVFSVFVEYTGNGNAGGQFIKNDITAKDFSKKNNGSGYYAVYSGASILIYTDADVLVTLEENDIEFNSVFIDVWRTDVASSKYRYNSLVGIEKSIDMSTDAAEVVSDHILSLGVDGFTISKVSNTLSGKYVCNSKLCTRLRWYKDQTGAYVIQAYNPTTKFLVDIWKPLVTASPYTFRNPLDTSIDYMENTQASSSMAVLPAIVATPISEFKRLYWYTGTIQSVTTSKVCLFDNGSKNFQFPSVAGALLYYNYSFANSEYMQVGLFDNAVVGEWIPSLDINLKKRKISMVQLKNMTNAVHHHVFITAISPKTTNYKFTNTVSATVADPRIIIEEGRFKFTAVADVLVNQQHIYVIEFDSNLSTLISKSELV